MIINSHEIYYFYHHIPCYIHTDTFTLNQQKSILPYQQFSFYKQYYLYDFQNLFFHIHTHTTENFKIRHINIYVFWRFVLELREGDIPH